MLRLDVKSGNTATSAKKSGSIAFIIYQDLDSTLIYNNKLAYKRKKHIYKPREPRRLNWSREQQLSILATRNNGFVVRINYQKTPILFYLPIYPNVMMSKKT